MPDLDLQLTVDRTSLGYGPLNCNDGNRYVVAQEAFASRDLSWNRVQINSIFFDGATTVARNRPLVNLPITFEVKGTSASDLQANLTELKTAFSQDSYTIDLHIDGAEYQYQAEAADYSERWVGSRWVARQLQIAFIVPTQPILLVGGES